MTRVNANIFRQALLRESLIVLPLAVLGDAGHGATKEPSVLEGMDHGDVQGLTSAAEGGTPKAAKMKLDGQGGAAATSGHWMAPAEAARRGNPVPANDASRERKLFEANCASCHRPTGRGNGPLAAGLETLPADLVAMARQHPDGDFAWKIASGRGPMPGWKETLTENQIWDLVNFIQNLGDAGKSEHAPPSGHRH